MGRNWTPEQKNAIEARGGSILVSAAAGSGKTAVLVERVIKRLSDEANPCDADRLLIVTFTKAAAAEMRERIGKALADGLKQNPDNRLLHRQQLLLPNANISTIDSFCSSLVRDNFDSLDISPDFRTIDEAEKKLLTESAVDCVIERMFSDGDEDFVTLSNLLYNGKSDSELSSVIERLYESSQAYPFPEKWLDSLTDEICGSSIDGTYFGSVILSYVTDAAKYCYRLNTVMLDAVQAENSDALSSKMLPFIMKDREQLQRIIEFAQGREWDAVYHCVHEFYFEKKAIVPKDFKGSRVDVLIKNLRDTVKKTVNSLKTCLCTDTDEFLRDGEYLRYPVQALIKAVKLFSLEYSTLKKERNALDFSDIEHMAISLLVKPDENGCTKTDLAENLSRQFEEILLDEYQDTNDAQDMLFRAISRNEENLFRVGDVKQCIYCFRQAMPDIFVKLRDNCAAYDGKNYPAKINLGCNFRSRKEVTDTVNFIFSMLMSRSCGDVDYDDSEKLIAAAEYPPSEDKTSELHILTLSAESEMSSDEQQAEYVAGLVENLLQSGMTVSDSGIVRPVRKSDICILMRSLSSRGTTYSDALKKHGISSSTEASSDFLSAVEISVMLSLLRIIDNPCQDIPLISVMLSPVFGFTPDEISLLRTDSDGESLYARALALAAGSNEKYAAFIEKINEFRLYGTCLSTHELIRKIYAQTGYYACVGAMSESAKRKANLDLLVSYAAEYEAQGYIGLSGFIRFIDRLPENEKSLSGAIESGDMADAVKIMTVHKSKGLEFPVVILASCSTGFNSQDEKGCAVIDSTHGIGIKMQNEATLARFDTVSHMGARLSIKRSRISEEMRILYVALTRTKEKLITVCATKDRQKLLSKLAVNIMSGNKADAFCVCGASCPADWLISAFLRHTDCRVLREEANIDEEYVIDGGGSLILKLADFNESEHGTADTQVTQPEADMTGQIGERLSYTYKYESLFGLSTKKTASGITPAAVDYDSFASSKPAFMSEDELTPAQKGTAVHRFMELCSYENAEQDVENEINRLVSASLLTAKEAQAINRRKISSFFNSGLYSRIKASPRVYREKKFLIEIPVNEMYDDLPDFIDEKAVIQGVADCAFEEDGKLVIVDYKTDRTADEAVLSSRYSSQLKIYKKALSMCTGLDIKQTLLWSFYMEKDVELTV